MCSCCRFAASRCCLALLLLLLLVLLLLLLCCCGFAAADWVHAVAPSTPRPQYRIHYGFNWFYLKKSLHIHPVPPLSFFLYTRFCFGLLSSRFFPLHTNLSSTPLFSSSYYYISMLNFVQILSTCTGLGC